jgi:hypothetical protein
MLAREAAPQAAMWMGPVSPLAVKLMAFGKLALIQASKAGSERSMNGRSPRLDNDGDVIVVAVTEPVKRQSASTYRGLLNF